MRNLYFPPVILNSNYVEQFAIQNYLIPDSKLNFQENLDNVFKKVNKTICLT